MRKTTRFKNLVLAPEILVLPGAHDALTARIVEQSGFPAVTIGGYPSSASLLGKPDVSLLTLTEVVACVARIADAVEIPLFADGDTGHGGVLNVIRTVREIERAGAAGMFIEDQQFPKRCGHMEGKQVIEPEDMVAKVKAAVDARQDPDFVIMARTDALAVHGVDDAIERANRYLEAGADLIFVEAPRSVDEMRRITHEVTGPTMANNVEGGKSPLLPAQELQEIGYSVVAFPISATYTVAHAVREVMQHLRDHGTTQGSLDRMITFAAFNELVGLAAARAKESSYYELPAALP